MIEKRICGYDINGWRDFAVRNFEINDGKTLNDTRNREVGTLTGVVRFKDSYWVGGTQASLAPHGCGNAWDEIGNAPRHDVINLLSGKIEDNDDEALTAAILGATSSADYSIFAINDMQDSNEELQERLINSAGRLKHKESLAVWRSVLAVLYARENCDNVRNLEEGSQILVLSQTGTALIGQKLGIRQTNEEGDPDQFMAPERCHKEYREISSEFGFDFCVKSILNQTGHQNIRSYSALPLSIRSAIMGIKAKPSLVRTSQNNWEVMGGFNEVKLPSLKIRKKDKQWGLSASVVILETVAGSKISKQLKQSIEVELEREVILLPPDAVARGAMIAADRMQKKQTVYLDFLPKISTIVKIGIEPVSHELIDSSKTLRAGKLYKCPTPAKFKVNAGINNIDIYILKETAKWPRKINCNLGREVTNKSTVEVRVEQKPAAGKAHILLRIAELKRDFRLDWDKAEEIEMEWDEIIEELKLESIPNRLVLECDTEAWYEENDHTGNHIISLSKALSDAVSQSGKIDWEQLAQKMSARPKGKYAVSSDGEIPIDINQENNNNLKNISNKAKKQFHLRLNGSPGDNQAIKFLTWQFRRCDKQVVEKLIKIMEGNCTTNVFDGNSQVLLFQGIGRTAQSKKQEERVLKFLLNRPPSEWRWRCETACAAFLLSRSKSAPYFLDRSDIEVMAEVVLNEFKSELCRRELNKKYTKFNYAPFLMAGLLRYRLKEINALLVDVDYSDDDPIAKEFIDAINCTLKDFCRIREQKKIAIKLKNRINKYEKILKEIKKYLKGQGADPNILIGIANSKNT